MRARFLPRLGRAALTIWAISVIAFVLPRLSGDPTVVLIPPEAGQAQRDALRAELRLDRPLPVQYALSAGSALRGDFGESYRFGTPASELFWRRFPNTLLLACWASLAALVLGLGSGLLAAAFDGSLLGRVIGLFTVFGQATPSFVLAIAAVSLFAVELGWLPTSGKGGPASFVLPVLSLSAFSAAGIARLARGTLLDVLNADFVRVARAKGLREATVIWRHALPHALTPVASVFSLHLAFFLGGSVVIETIFAWPGVGQLMLQSVLSRDYAVVQTVLVFASFFVVATGLALDVLYSLLDPRIRAK